DGRDAGRAGGRAECDGRNDITDLIRELPLHTSLHCAVWLAASGITRSQSNAVTGIWGEEGVECCERCHSARPQPVWRPSQARRKNDNGRRNPPPVDSSDRGGDVYSPPPGS